jgi:two-component system CheB/CheR fusion protein
MGYLFLGSSESLGDLQSDFQTLSARNKIWQVLRPTSLPLELNRSNTTTTPGIPLGRRSATQASPMPRSAVDQGLAALSRAFAPPPAILVNGSHELVHSYGEVNRFLEWKEGQATLDINRMLPDPLVPVAAALLFKSAREGSSVKSDIVRLPVAGGLLDASGQPQRRHVRLSSWPVGEVEGQRLTLLVFEEVNLAERPDALVMVNVDNENTERLEVLEHELAATRESLQATIEELETSNEELQATNEELMASNEELQSSNEELQSVNEELNTVNAEYQEKIEILNRVNADLDNLARVISAGTVFVDEHLQLTRFSPDAARIFRLRDTDVGRPLGDLTHALEFPDFLAELQRSLTDSLMIERAVQSHDGRHFLVKMLPYRIPSSAARGVVISFIDMTAVHQASRLQDIIDALAEHIAVLDEQGRIVLVNTAWSNFARENGDPDMVHSGPGISYLEMCKAGPGSSDVSSAQSAAEGLRRVLDGRQEHFSMEYPCHSPTEERWFVMHARRLYGETMGAVVSHVNITAWRQEAAS